MHRLRCYRMHRQKILFGEGHQIHRPKGMHESCAIRLLFVPSFRLNRHRAELIDFPDVGLE